MFVILFRMQRSIHNWSIFWCTNIKIFTSVQHFFVFTLNWINNVLDVITEYVRMITQKINSLLYDQRKMKVYQRHLTTVTTENYTFSLLRKNLLVLFKTLSQYKKGYELLILFVERTTLFPIFHFNQYGFSTDLS